MRARAAALTAFYDGPVWARHRDAANATMLDSDDVLLLRPVGPSALPPATPGGRSVLTATVHLLREPAGEGFLRWYTAEVEPVLERAGSRRLALLETEPAPNTFPRLPVREGVSALVRLAAFPDEATLAAVQQRVGTSPGWAAATQILRLRPTSRSAIR
jgi:hypothetical protein